MLPRNRPCTRRTSGFSLIEIVIAVAVLALIVGVVAMRSGGLISKGKSTSVTQLADTLKIACSSYHADTGQMPWEYSGYDAANRRLSGTQTVAGWNGPYLEKPLTSGSNPSGGSIHLYNVANVNGNDGFDTDADGSLDVTSNGCTLWMSGVPESDAKAIDATLDKGLGGSWATGGRVEWAANGNLWILVYF
jgi:general secretion pathway protein G